MKVVTKVEEGKYATDLFSRTDLLGITIVLLLWDNVSSLKRLNNKLLLKIISSSHHQSKLYE